MAVYRAFEHNWDEKVFKFRRPQPNRTLAKKLFGEIFTPVWNKTMTISNIQRGFRNCGIYPFDNSVILDHGFTPSNVP